MIENSYIHVSRHINLGNNNIDNYYNNNSDKKTNDNDYDNDNNNSNNSGNSGFLMIMIRIITSIGPKLATQPVAAGIGIIIRH